MSIQLARKIFNDSFWSKTAWTGGRKADEPKFAFAKHVTFIAFFNDVMRECHGASMSDAAFADFVKSRTRNSGYSRKTNRMPAARVRGPRQIEADNEGGSDHDDNSSLINQ